MPDVERSNVIIDEARTYACRARERDGAQDARVAGLREAHEREERCRPCRVLPQSSDAVRRCAPRRRLP